MTIDYYIKIHERIHMIKVKKYLILNIIDHPSLYNKKKKKKIAVLSNSKACR